MLEINLVGWRNPELNYGEAWSYLVGKERYRCYPSTITTEWEVRMSYQQIMVEKPHVSERERRWIWLKLNNLSNPITIIIAAPYSMRRILALQLL